MPQQRQQPTEFPTGQQIQGATAVGDPEGADDLAQAISVPVETLQRCAHELRRWRLEAKTAQSPSSIEKRSGALYVRIK